jgi:hypothetical protein
MFRTGGTAQVQNLPLKVHVSLRWALQWATRAKLAS